jgi:two-component system chemotaxis response regulator CheB
MPTGRDIVCIGGSAGGLEPLRQILRALPSDLEASLFVVEHSGPDTRMMLADLLGACSRLPVDVVVDEEEIRTGRVYVAAADHHLLVKRGFVRAVRGPRENGFRPALDPLFRTAAEAYGKRVVGVVLSGGQNDGSAGLVAIHEAGGATIVQDPDDAMVPEMPNSVLAVLTPDFVARPAGIAATIVRLATRTTVGEPSVPPSNPRGADSAEFPVDALRTGALPGPPSSFVCPECDGALWEVVEGDVLKFRCHVGHAFTAENLLSEKDRALEGVLWSALRSLEENAALRRRMARRVQSQWPRLAASYEKIAAECDAQSAVLRKLLTEPRGRAQRDDRGRERRRRTRARRGTRRTMGARAARPAHE